MQAPPPPLLTVTEVVPVAMGMKYERAWSHAPWPVVVVCIGAGCPLIMAPPAAWNSSTAPAGAGCWKVTVLVPVVYTGLIGWISVNGVAALRLTSDQCQVPLPQFGYWFCSFAQAFGAL